MTNEDWLALLKLGAQGAGVAGGMGAFGGAPGAVPGGSTMSGADLGGNLTAGGLNPPVPPPDFGAGIPGQARLPGMEQGGIGSDMERAGIAPVQGPPPPQRNLGLPSSPAATPTTPPPPTTPMTPEDVNFVRSTLYPPGSPAATPMSPLTAEAVNATTASSDPRSWWQRNISDPWDKAWKEDPKTGISPAQKTLAGLGTSAGSAATSAASSKTPAAAPAGSVYKPTPINAAQMALSREQQLELLRRRAQLRTPWLNRFQPEQRSAGLMG